ncbi:MAG TPA: hypothetical protein PKW54_05005 [Ferruginibacter sp.]|nr:hypothetical protein [Ferruginibacter sp.]
MKTNNNNLNHSLSLNRELKENNLSQPVNKMIKAFCSAELWDIQRRQRTLTSRRRFI